MPYQTAIRLLEGGSVFAECGPMRLVISASIGKIPQPEAGSRAATESFGYLKRVARLRPLLIKKNRPNDVTANDVLAENMIKSALLIQDDDLTPMAAVAGTLADAVADFLYERGMTKVVVNNGGDVAVRLQKKEMITVGIRPDVNQKEVTHVISLDDRYPFWGIATSGFGGRSFTRGIASATTVIARTASVADAAATAIANATYVEDAKIFQEPAERIDPDTDIPGIPVTVKVGALPEHKKQQALSGAINKAKNLVDNNIILGAFVAVQGQIAMTGLIEKLLVD